MRRVISSLIFLIVLFSVCQGKQAVVIVPVADLLGNQSGEKAYQGLGLCAKPVEFCIRLHQLLYNEIVTIEEEKGAEARVRISSAFYELTPGGAPQTSYWTLRKNLLPMAELVARAIPIDTIPEPLSFNPRKSSGNHQRIVALLQPHYDPRTQTTYSVGTRFVRTEKNTQTNQIEVFAFNRHLNTPLTISLPINKCIESSNDRSWDERREIFLRLLHSWAHQNNGYIPYVWGGCSFTTHENEPHFISMPAAKGATLFVPRTQKKMCSGFDCAGLIARAAQLAGIPYYYKNTATIANHLKEISHARDIQNGDLIWFPGHVIVISDVSRNSIIEARAYGQGYGKIHELPVSTVFKNIETVSQLLAHAREKKMIYRLQKDGSVAHSIATLKILQLSSTLTN
ncbi:C40 family peptidase [Candidatus Dependentiae bacterium]|nr:C40 family peptidase [Candidatus Dependentiae bacterium]